MKNVIEKFINNCIVAEKKNRLFFEFEKLNYRNKLLDRFSHNVEELIISSKVIKKIEKKDLTENTIFDYSKTFNKNLVFSSLNLEPKLYDIKQALEIINNDFSPVLIFTDNVCIIKSEDSLNTYVYLLTCD